MQKLGVTVHGSLPEPPLKLPPPPPVAALPASTAASAEEKANLSDGGMQRRTLLPANPDRPSAGPISLPDGVEPWVFATKQQRAAAWAKYNRSLTDGPSKEHVTEDDQRAKRTEKMPDDIKAQIAGLHEKAFYFQIWMSCDKKWGNVKSFEEMYLERRFGTKKSEAWLTDGQMMFIFQDREVVDAMQEVCEAENTFEKPSVRAHPKLPRLRKAQQFKCQIEDHEVERVEHVLKRGIRLEHDLDGNDAGDANIVRQCLARARGALGAAPATAATANSSPSATLPASAPVAQTANNGSGGSAAVATASALGAGGAPPGETLEEKKKRERLEKFQHDEERRKDRVAKAQVKKELAAETRRVERETEKQRRADALKTPEGRARVWLGGLQEFIQKADKEVTHCEDKENCALPEGLRTEYSSHWKNKSSGFKRARTSIENVLNGKKEAKDFSAVVDKAEQDVKDFKTDLQRYKTLENGYIKATKKAQATEAAADADDDQDADAEGAT